MWTRMWTNRLFNKRHFSTEQLSQNSVFEFLSKNIRMATAAGSALASVGFLFAQLSFISQTMDYNKEQHHRDMEQQNRSMADIKEQQDRHMADIKEQQHRDMADIKDQQMRLSDKLDKAITLFSENAA
jgi:septal ring factor EnvC (AmiA/AmiB activator)